MAAELDTLCEAIDGLTALDPGVLSDDELHGAVLAVQRERARLGLVAGRLLARWDTRRLWATDGSRNAAARLARDTVCAPATAAVELRRARQLRSLPATAAAIERGSLSLDHVDLLGRANQAHRAPLMQRDEELLVEACGRLRFRQATRALQYWCQRADAATDHDSLEEDGAHLHVSSTLDGTVALAGTLDAISGAIVAKELGRLERQLYHVDQRDGRARTRSQRQAAALVVMAQRSAARPAGSRPPAPLFTVLVGDTAFTELCELANGVVVTPRQLAPWLTTAHLETILFDGPSTVVSVSRRRTFAGAVRRAIEVRDRHCQHPSGCDVAAEECDVDHIVAHAHGGLTSQFNGRLECSTHNRHADLHDHHALPRADRPVTRLDELRARLRWRALHDGTRGSPSALSLAG